MRSTAAAIAELDAQAPEMSPEMRAAYERWREERRAEAGKLSSRGMEKKAATGTMPGCAPTGYRNVNGKIEIDLVLGPLVREAFERAATSDLPLRALLAEMTAKGLVSRNGKPMKVSAFWYMLKNPFYVGMIRWKGQLIPGRHEPLLSEGQFSKAQAAGDYGNVSQIGGVQY